jgi:hypothetical protein
MWIDGTKQNGEKLIPKDILQDIEEEYRSAATVERHPFLGVP